MSEPLDQVVSALKQFKEYEAAKKLLNTFAKYSSTVTQYDTIARLQNEIKDYRGSIENLKRCLAISVNPQETYAIRSNIAKMYNHLNEPSESMVYSNANLAVLPGDFDSYMELSFARYLSGDYEGSEKILRELKTIENLPEEVLGRVNYNLATYDLEAGNFKKGLAGTVGYGHDIGIIPVREIPMIPKWDGTVVKGQTVLILAEGGIGDEIIGIRFHPYIAALGMNPIWVTKNTDLANVFNRNGYHTVTDPEGLDLSNAVQCLAFYAPVLLGLDKDEVFYGPYLQPAKEYLVKWKDILPGGLKIAFKWFGNKEYDQDLHRSIPYEEMLKIGKQSGVTNETIVNGKIYTRLSLQLEGVPGWSDEMVDLANGINSIEDTLAIISLCDYTITSCTSVAHMVGALGKAGVVCPPIASYYCWLGKENEGRSNWYSDSLKVVRQKKHKNWAETIEKVNEILG